MTSLGTIIGRGATGSRPAAGTPGALYFDTTRSVMRRDNGSTWDDVEGAGGLSNPMTTQDDIIVGGSSGTPARLAKGTDGQVLTVDPTTHHLLWATPSGGTGDSTWTALTLVNSWTNLGSGFNSAECRKDGSGVVHLRGVIHNGSAIGATITTLPSGYRPEHTQTGLGWSGTVAIQLEIDTAGVVHVLSAPSGSGTADVELDGISFYAV